MLVTAKAEGIIFWFTFLFLFIFLYLCQLHEHNIVMMSWWHFLKYPQDMIDTHSLTIKTKTILILVMKENLKWNSVLALCMQYLRHRSRNKSCFFFVFFSLDHDAPMCKKTHHKRPKERMNLGEKIFSLHIPCSHMDNKAHLFRLMNHKKQTSKFYCQTAAFFIIFN